MTSVPTQGKTCPSMKPPGGIALQRQSLTLALGPLDPARPEGLGFSVMCTNTHPSCLGCCVAVSHVPGRAGTWDRNKQCRRTSPAPFRRKAPGVCAAHPLTLGAQARGRQSTASGGERLLTCAGLAMVSGSAAEYTVEKKETP